MQTCTNLALPLPPGRSLLRSSLEGRRSGSETRSAWSRKGGDDTGAVSTALRSTAPWALDRSRPSSGAWVTRTETIPKTEEHAICVLRAPRQENWTLFTPSHWHYSLALLAFTFTTSNKARPTAVTYSFTLCSLLIFSRHSVWCSPPNGRELHESKWPRMEYCIVVRKPRTPKFRTA